MRNLRESKEIHDTYKKMYEDTSNTLLKIESENGKLRKVVARLERAISRATTCRYFDVCPIGDELQKQSDRDEPRTERKVRNTGQRQRDSPANNETNRNPADKISDGFIVV
ncbi:hypothetical protein FACS1894162_3630 [Bacteroidia bacterium]|nr:hypothetical protein FACS1894162_3630 [Bacteroidia bacterium]